MKRNVWIIASLFLAACSGGDSEATERSAEIDQDVGSLTWHGYNCTEDCSGHEAGYDWAERKGIDDVADCGGNSQSFIEGCEAYVEENY
jgi:hypothetical protein